MVSFSPFFPPRYLARGLVFPSLPEEEKEEETRQKAIDAIEIAELSLQELLAASSPDWESAAELYLEAAQNYLVLKNCVKSIEYYIQGAFCQLRTAHYEKAAHLFNSARFQLSLLPEEALKSQCSPTFAMLLSTHLPQLLPLDVAKGLCPFLKSAAKLYGVLEVHEQAASYFALCGTCYISDNWEAIDCFYQAGIEMNQSPPSLATREKTISFFKKAVLVGRSIHKEEVVQKALKQISLQYLSLACLEEAAAALKQAAELYCPDFATRGIKYLSSAIPLYEKLNDFQLAADCWMLLVKFHNHKGDFLQVAESAHKAAQFYIQSGALEMAHTALSKAESHYRNLSPPLWQKSMNCVELQTNLFIQQNLPEEAGLCLYRTALAMQSHRRYNSAAHYFAAAAEHLTLAKRHELALEALTFAGELYEREGAYAYSGQAFERATFLCTTLQKKHELTYFFYLAGEVFYKAGEYLKAATCYEQAVRTRPFAAAYFRMHEYDTAATKATRCRDKLTPPRQKPPSFVPSHPPVFRNPWEEPIKNCLEKCAKARHPEAIKTLIEQLDDYKEWPRIMAFINQVPFPNFSDLELSNRRRKYFLFNFHTDKMSSEIYQNPLIDRIKDVSTILLTRAKLEL